MEKTSQRIMSYTSSFKAKEGGILGLHTAYTIRYNMHVRCFILTVFFVTGKSLIWMGNDYKIKTKGINKTHFVCAAHLTLSSAITP